MYKYLFFLTSISLFVLESIAQPLDKSFGKNGILITPFDTYTSGISDRIQAIALQQDGKIVSADAYFRIVRFQSNGVVDSTFATHGRIETEFAGYVLPTARAVTIQPDGKIIVAGDASSISVSDTKRDFVVTRYLSNGSIDTTFNNTGKKTINLQTGLKIPDNCYGAALQVDGKILLCGSTGDAFAIVRLKGDGTIDSSFNTTGIFQVEYGNYGGDLRAIAERPDGKILACGRAAFGGSDDRFYLLQFKPNGNLDSSFGINAVAVASPPSGGFVHDMAIQSDGKTIVAGRDLFNGGIMVRFNLDGSLDNTFGINGYAEIVSPNGIVGTEQIEISTDGRTYLSGHIEVNTANEDVYFIKCKSDGSIDSSYVQSESIIPIGIYKERIHAMAIQADGKILVAGEYRDSSSLDQYLLLRFNQFPENVPTTPHVGKLLELYPNPIQTEFTINSTSNGILKIVNVLGQTIETFSVSKGKNVYDFPDVSPGTYSCIFISDNNQLYRTTISHTK